MCVPSKIKLDGPGRRRFEVDFSAGRVSSDGGGILLREAAVRLRLFERLASCFTDHRKQHLIDHTVEELVAQRIVTLALGYEDLNDHEQLREDPLLGLLAGKLARRRGAGAPLAESQQPVAAVGPACTDASAGLQTARSG